MATNPYFTQLHTQRFSLVGNPQQRDGLTANDVRDQRFLNCYPELIKSPMTEGKKYYLKKRPGTGGLVAQTGASGGGRGCHYFAASGTYISVVGTGVYSNSTLLGTLSTSLGAVGFAEYEYNNGTVDLMFTDGTHLYLMTAALAITLVTAVTFPHIPQPIYLDGYLFLAQTGSGLIWNSALNDPTTWPADGFIDAEMYPDNIVMLTKAQNYLVAVGQQSIEFFYDNANSTGSPLQRNAPAVAQMGTPSPFSVVQTEQEFIFVGATGNGGRTVWVIKGFQPTEIGIEPIREALDDEGSSGGSIYAFCVQCSGHKFYVMNLPLSGRTYVYDFDEQMWHEWSTGTSQAMFFCNFSCDGPNGSPVVQSTSNGVLYTLAPDIYTDISGTSTIKVQITTIKLDFDTIKRKRMYRLSLICDGPNGTNNVPITVEFSDDDYNTWGVARTLNINGSYPTITQCGLFRRRACRFTYQQPYPLRIESFEVDITQEVRR